MPGDWEDQPEFKGHDYPVYEGELNCCSHCGRQFQWSDLIAVSKDERLAFCFYDIFDESITEVNCQVKWVMEKGEIVISRPLRFGGE